MKATRTSPLVGGSWRGLTRTRSITLRGVRALLSRIWTQALPEQGLGVDFADLTDAKINWRRNWLTQSEFANGLSDAPVRSGVTLATMAGFANAIQFTAGADAYAYKQMAQTAGTTYVLSVIVQMADGLAPVFTGAGDFALVTKGDVAVQTNYVVAARNDGNFRVSVPFTATTSVTSNWGVVKFAGNSARNFKVTGYMVERAALATAYQTITDAGPGDFLREFPNHSLFQDHVGNVPVTNVEQPIGMALDMRQSGFRGAELSPDVGMNTPAAWQFTGTAPLWAVSGGVAACTATSSGNRWITGGTVLTVGKWYEIYADVIVTAGGCLPDISSNYPVFATTSGRKHWILQATTTTLQFLAQPSFTGSIDNVSFREVPGNHALQPTANDRPNSHGRINWLLNSELVSDAVWAKSGAGTGSAPTITDNYGVAPDGTTTATRIQFALNGGTTTGDQSRLLQSITSVAGNYYPQSFWIKTNDGSTKTISFRDDFSGTVNVNVVVTPTWQQVFGGVNATANNTTVNAIGLWLRGGIGTSDSADVLLWHPQLERTATAPGKPMPYQRVGTTATDYDGLGFPKGAKFNGNNQWMFAAVDLSASDKVLAVASVRRDSDAATAIVVEHGPDSSANAGTFALFAPGSGGQATAAARGYGSSTTVGFSAAVPPAMASNVLAAMVDFAAPYIQLRRDGVQIASNVTPLGAGNFTSRTLYIGRRGGTSLPFNGVIYRLAVRGTAGENFIGLAERWANEPIKVYT